MHRQNNTCTNNQQTNACTDRTNTHTMFFEIFVELQKQTTYTKHSIRTIKGITPTPPTSIQLILTSTPHPRQKSSYIKKGMSSLLKVVWDVISEDLQRSTTARVIGITFWLDFAIE